MLVLEDEMESQHDPLASLLSHGPFRLCFKATLTGPTKKKVVYILGPGRVASAKHGSLKPSAS
jgi:hypothetical protein